MARFSLEAIVAIVGVIVTLPPSVILLWRLIGIGRSETPPRDVEALGIINVRLNVRLNVKITIHISIHIKVRIKLNVKINIILPNNNKSQSDGH
ncbi:uncharacterized protein PV07_00634 [Cladophialophora immunda]|uniref:Uncharacterized protein n=1 Tax=Cladophialophora immunda TaxID=569365 RepID=A0A0D2CRH1_9EURO|nr:uncharacterized protein PV07_00634 [Cladophialophora immunda]KIW33813.1 hypothetical protein PV07_00634 [Cladophialophora immunda]